MNNKLRITISLLLVVISALFLLMVLEVDVANIGPNGTSIGLSQFNYSISKAIGTNMTLYKLTEYAGYIAILIVLLFALTGLAELIKRKSFAKVDREIYALGALYIAIGIIYVFFEKVVINYRPVIMEGETAPEASFPSSHTLLALTVFLSAALVLGKYIKNKGLCTILRVILVLLAIFTVVGRLMSGVHWASDIIASVLFSATLLSFFLTVIKKDKRTE